MAEQMCDVTADGGDLVAFELDTGLIGEFVEVEGAFDSELVLVDAFELADLVVELVLDITHDLLQHVVERDDADCAAEFIDCQGHVDMFVEEEAQQLVDRHHFRHHVQFALDLAEVGLRLADQRQQILDMNDADRVVQMALDKWVARMLGVNGRLEASLEAVVGIE